MSQLIVQFYIVFNAVLNMFTFIKLHKIRKVYGLPVLVNLLLAIGVFYALYKVSSHSIGLLESLLIGEESNAFVEIVLLMVVHFLFWGIGLFSYQYVSLICIAPFLSFITEEVMNKLEGNEVKTSWSDFIPLLIRGARVTLRNLFLQVVISLFVYALLSWLVVTAVLIPFILFTVNAYFMGYAFLDYISEYKNLNFIESKQIVKGKAGLMLSVGSFYQFLLLIPVLGVMFAPSFATVVMCMAYKENEKKLISSTIV